MLWDVWWFTPATQLVLYRFLFISFRLFFMGHWNPETLEPRVEAPGHWNLGTLEPRVSVYLSRSTPRLISTSTRLREQRFFHAQGSGCETNASHTAGERVRDQRLSQHQPSPPCHGQTAGITFQLSLWRAVGGVSGLMCMLGDVWTIAHSRRHLSPRASSLYFLPLSSRHPGPQAWGFFLGFAALRGQSIRVRSFFFGDFLVFSVPFREQPEQPHHRRAHPGPLGGYRLLYEWVFLRQFLKCMSPNSCGFLHSSGERSTQSGNLTLRFYPVCAAALSHRQSDIVGGSEDFTPATLASLEQSRLFLPSRRVVRATARDPPLRSTKSEGEVSVGRAHHVSLRAGSCSSYEPVT